MDLVFINVQGVFWAIHITQVLFCIVAAMILQSIKKEWQVLYCIQRGLFMIGCPNVITQSGQFIAVAAAVHGANGDSKQSHF
jgi:hypothetical protein